jgi:hypothetical protein
MEQLEARWAHNPKVVGSSPTPANFTSISSHGGVAQWLEQRNHNPWVAGSNPATVIKLKNETN